ncbi:aldo/keto reductase [Micrococcus porci]|uniref:aldo/keto reductase n=1 Tax=Micrococcus porci TaxID=2856555 RepID=UPI003CF572D1
MTAQDTAPQTPAASPLVLGTMGWGDVERARGALRAGLEAGIGLLDTADIYGAGASEETVGALLAELDPAERTRLRVQTKSGIVLHEPGPDGTPAVRYDNSPAYLHERLALSLGRLGLDRVDTLVVHRPDVLTPVSDTVRAFLDAREAGRVDALGVSNMGTRRVLEYQHALRKVSADGTGLACVQVELGLHHRMLVESVVLANHPAAAPDGGAGDLGEVCAGEGIEIQAWGPLGRGRFTRGSDGTVPADPAEQAALAAAGGAPAVVARVARELEVSREAVVLAWLLRLPWGVRPVVGTQDPARIASCAQAADAAARMDGAQWHRLWTAARGETLP